MPAFLRTAWAIVRFDRRLIATVSADRPLGRALAFVVVPAIVLTAYTVAITYWQLWDGFAAFGAEGSIWHVIYYALPQLLLRAPLGLASQIILIAGVLAMLTKGISFRGCVRIVAYASLFHCFSIVGVAPWIAFVYACIRARVGDDGHPAELALAATVVLVGLVVVGWLV